MTDQADAVAEKARSPGLVGADVGRMVGQHGLKGLGQHRQGDGVGRRAAEDETDVSVGVQPLADLVGGPRRDRIGAVGGNEAGVGLDQALQGAGRHSGGVVGSEIVTHQRVFVLVSSAWFGSTVRTRTTGMTSSSP